MNTSNATEARANLSRLIREATESHEPVLITGRGGDAVLIAKEDWDAIQEALFLLSIPGMRESICKGLETPVDECGTDLDW